MSGENISLVAAGVIFGGSLAFLGLIMLGDKFFLGWPVLALGVGGFVLSIYGIIKLPKYGDTRMGCVKHSLEEITTMTKAYPSKTVDFVCVKEGVEVYTINNRWEELR